LKNSKKKNEKAKSITVSFSFLYELTRSCRRPLCAVRRRANHEKTTHLISEDGDNHFSGLEDIDHAVDDIFVGSLGNVGLEADVREVGLWRDVDGHVMTHFGYPIHGVTAWLEQIIVNPHVGDYFVNARFL